jgi:hypothetical protein
LRRDGVTLTQIAQAARVPLGTISRLARGIDDDAKPGRMGCWTAARVLSVTPENAARVARGRVDGLGTRRRIQALVALGWPLPELAHRLDRTPQNLRASLASGRVAASTATAVGELYKQLWDKDPTAWGGVAPRHAREARELARRCGWPAPLAWDDIDHDHATAAIPAEGGEIDELDVEIAIERLLNGVPVRLRIGERDEVIARLTARGHSLPRIAELLGVSDRTISRRRARRAA